MTYIVVCIECCQMEPLWHSVMLLYPPFLFIHISSIVVLLWSGMHISLVPVVWFACISSVQLLCTIIQYTAAIVVLWNFCLPYNKAMRFSIIMMACYITIHNVPQWSLGLIAFVHTSISLLWWHQTTIVVYCGVLCCLAQNHYVEEVYNMIYHGRGEDMQFHNAQIGWVVFRWHTTAITDSLLQFW